MGSSCPGQIEVESVLMKSHHALIGVTSNGDAYWFASGAEAVAWLEPLDANDEGIIWFDESGGEVRVSTTEPGWSGRVVLQYLERSVPTEAVGRLRGYLEALLDEDLTSLSFDQLVSRMRELHDRS